jgi:methylenetetrahydrofolate dehydrogenase (NADP+)/methenyltetrahydrofolate cyclohydrolase
VIIDGKHIAEEIVRGLGESLRGARLGLVVGSDDPATQSFVKIKTRVAERLGVVVVRGSLGELAATCDGVIIQMPHPDAEQLIGKLPPALDVDGIGESPRVRPPVAEAIAEVLRRSGVTVAGAQAVVVGAGRLVGAPAARLLRDLGAQVEVVTLEQGSLAALLSADIVVLGAGEPGLVKPEMLKEGVVLIDAGTSDVSGVVMGDAEPSCAEVASVFTPTPGGIGPIAVAMLYRNLFMLKREQEKARA